MARKRQTSSRRHDGKRPSQLWYTPEQYELVKRAAQVDGRSMVNFAKRATVAAARQMMR